MSAPKRILLLALFITAAAGVVAVMVLQPVPAHLEMPNPRSSLADPPYTEPISLFGDPQGRSNPAPTEAPPVNIGGAQPVVKPVGMRARPERTIAEIALEAMAMAEMRNAINPPARVREAPEGDDPEDGPNEFDFESGPWPVSKEGITAAIAAHMPDLQECYEAWSPTDPELEGDLTVSFTIAPPAEDGGTEPNGTPKRAQILNLQMTRGDLGHPMVIGCVKNIAASLHFDAPEGAVAVNYPFTFKKTESKDDGQ